MIKFTIS